MLVVCAGLNCEKVTVSIGILRILNFFGKLEVNSEKLDVFRKI
jgi:hypothetical protein